MISLKVEVEGLKAALLNFAERAWDELETAMDLAGRAIVQRFRENQLSGRRAYDLGLNIVTGNLYESLRSVAFRQGQKLGSEIYNRGAQYWYYHQEGLGFNPKRLWLSEDFEKEGAKLYATEVELALGRLA